MALCGQSDFLRNELAMVQSKVDGIQAGFGELIRDVSVKRDSLRSDVSCLSYISETEGAFDRESVADSKTPQSSTRKPTTRSSILSVTSTSTAASEEDRDLSYPSSSIIPPVALTLGVEVHAVGLHVASKMMHSIPWSRILVLRKLHKLGFDAPNALVQYLTQYGEIERIILLPSRRKMGRMRPSSTGFVIFAADESVQAMLKLGETHSIRGIPVDLSNYEEQAETADYADYVYQADGMYL